jgi:hypothetical protein
MSEANVEVVRRGTWLALLVLLISASSAWALPLRKLGPGSVWTDGDRYAVFFPPDQIERPRQILDERTGRRYAVSAPTSPPTAGFQTSCRFGFVAAGSVLWSCPFDKSPYLLTDVATGLTRTVPGWDNLERSLSEFKDEPSAPSVNVRGFGRRWLHVQVHGWHALLANRWLDWRTGTLVADNPGGRRAVIDLDDSRLAVPLCSPLRRRIEPFEGYGPDVVIPYVYEQGWLFNSDYSVQSHAIKIRRCGSRRSLVLHRCRHTCGDASFGAGYVTWLDKETFSVFNQPRILRDETVVFAYDVRGHRRLGFRANFGRQPPEYLWHTRKHIYGHTRLTSPTLYVGRLPERR